MASAAPPSFAAVEAMDHSLARLARSSGSLRFGLGMGLEALARMGGHHELGFASLEAYALERCERSARWVQESRHLARRLALLPELRLALVSGKISFSMAQVVGKVASADDESAWLAEAQTCTVREIRHHVKKRAESASMCVEADGNPEHELSASVDAELATLTVTVDREDAWLFECAHKIVQELAGTTLNETIQALLGEGTTSLLASVPRDGFEPFDDSAREIAQRQWEAQLSRWREEAEARCEARFRAGAAKEAEPAESEELVLAFEGDAATIDAKLREIAGALSVRDLAFGRLAETFWKADGWLRLGYASAAQYARERLGTSLSSIKAKRVLARRAEALPGLSTALAQRELGYEAARLVGSVATPDTLDVWLERAAERTVRYLREEVDAVQMFRRLAPGSSALPPDEATMLELAALESRILSGALFQQADDKTASCSPLQSGGERALAWASHQSNEGQMSAGLAGLLQAFEHAHRRSRARHAGRVTLRFRLSAETQRYYRWLERLYQRCGPAHVSFLRFLCCALIEAWQHTLGSTAKYAGVYGRDRHRCTSPVCGRRDVTPHHLKFRSAGGDDSDQNLTSLCVWCHLEGIHGGRLQASPPASDITWTIGRTAHTVVRGRRRAGA